ncbi:ribonuclease J [Desulforhabdus amnigena]|jgi:ribonuclease J|uniref:Ribonuclease J n=1 Tax=Desulforhabdus amnigena TaxID=40218 RepID=A0A9W6L8T6_9BACT|nr:ribonuclease J [Desulforhabdus amnigena]NLJ29119.1 ribonuclease J [Deltaproteobacteria bacterium]GLI36043.1 ribonuclease J [Desulforhabdus amnigena]
MPNSSNTQPFLKVIPLGGLGEIGLNMMVMEYDETLILIDSGLMFPEDDMLGIDIVIPDFSYIQKNRDRVRALIVTHGHEDHIGAIPFLLREFQIPIYGTPLSLALIREKLKEHGLLERSELNQVLPREQISIGPFQIEFLQVCHSIPDGVGLAIRTPVGILIHSGDFKIDNTPIDGRRFDMARFGAYGEEGVLALFSDSTNVERPGYTLSERDVGNTLREIFQECAGRIIVAVFASNLNRIQQVIRLAREFNRKVLLNGRSMAVNVRIARELGYLNFPPEEEITLQELARLPDSEVLMLTTGSQGEPMSALTRMAFDDHKKLKVQRGDTIILSSKFIPGNERTIQNIINHLYRHGAEVIHEQVRDIHVSGHAYRQELKTMISLVKPRFFIPVHGEYRHLVKHRQLAIDMGIPEENCLLAEDGSTILCGPDQISIGERVPTGRVLVDGKGVGDVEGVVLRDRRHLSEDGLVIVSLVIDKETSEILSGPDILSKGFIQEETHSEILDSAKCVILEVLDNLLEKDYEVDTSVLQAEIHRELKRFFNRVLYRRPVIYAIVVDI